jgi:hypothetical protein
MSKPTQFKITHDKKKLVVINQDKDTKKCIVEVYSLPDFNKQDATLELPLDKIDDVVISYKYLDISDDN